MSEVFYIIAWYALLTALSWLALPIAYRLLPALPERGYAMLRPLALLLWGFIFWLLSSFGLLANSAAGLLTALLLLAGLAIWAWRSQPAGALGAWLRAQRGQILATELVYLLAFIFMLWMRASYPRVEGTEKPMELAFINAILQSPSMPPQDPWLSGYSISYYYFGFLMVALKAKLLSIPGAIAFNLGLANVFAMGAAAAYGLTYNLLAVYKPTLMRTARWLAGLAPLLMLVMGNVEGLLEIVHARHLFWETNAAGETQSAFWVWLDVKELVNPPIEEPRWVPRYFDTGSWWWWRASRVINDRTFDGGEQELIDEFPAFSFVLGDLHPHVLSIPFVLLATGVALNTYLGGSERKKPRMGLYIREESLALAALVIGALAFLNIWDLPIYAILFAGAYVLRRATQEGWGRERLNEFLNLVVLVGVTGILFFLPFFIGFTSQAGGILPNLLTPTRGTHLWIMFATLLTPLLLWALWQWKQRGWAGLPRALLYSLAFVAALWLGSFLLIPLFSVFSGAFAFIAGIFLGIESMLLHLSETVFSFLRGLLSGFFIKLSELFAQLGVASMAGAPDLGSLFAESLRRRFAGPGGWLTLIVLLGLLGGLLAAGKAGRSKQPAETASHFAVLMALVAALLVTAPEFIYLRDQFGTRMNTVFKFYYQAWLLWSVVAAFGISVLMLELRRGARLAAATLVFVVLGAGFVYPAYAFADIASRPQGQPLTLDGSIHLPPDAREAIAWLQTAEPGVLAEAVGGSYSAYARYATFTGMQNVMGWPGHEGQWRGGNVDYGRIGAIESLYSTGDWVTASEILQRYSINYVIVGDLERAAYSVNEAKFQARLPLVFQNGTVSIYAVP
ncbi:MAG: hypothetical protein KIT08_07710 [Anaerolineales bacterium]|nr:MAG: hypothetical protein KIT08_07710 [Anaerolineales bacterium]